MPFRSMFILLMKKNADFSYADLTEEAYYDTYLDGILTILESHLADMTFGEATTLDIPLEKNSDGLYTISEDTLTAIQNTLLPWPETASTTGNNVRMRFRSFYKLTN